jgi:hypothetical protein
MRVTLLVVAVALAAAGCKKPGSGSAAPAANAGGGAAPAGDEKRVQNDLKTIGLAFLNYCDATKGNPFTSPVPADFAALERYLGDDPAVAKAVKDGTYKVFWSAPAAQKIIACERDAEAKGGWVCLRFGDAQKMTAAEVRDAIGKK